MLRLGLALTLGTMLTLAGPAHAGNSSAPGLLAKQPPTATETTATTAPAPAAPTPAKPEAKAPAKAQAPVTKGTVKKLVQTAPAPSGDGGSTSTAAVRTHRRTSMRASGARSSPATRSARTATVRARTRAAGKSPGAAAPAAAHAVTRAQEPAPVAAPAAGAHPKRHAAHAARPRPVKAADKQTAPLVTISQAADRVIEVIPGAVMLALAGLASLVLVLVARSWAMERRRGRALAASYGITVEALATAIEAKDLTTGGHIERVRKLGLLLASEVVPREARDPQMAYGFLLHDIGKLAVPDAILCAPGRLTEEQWRLMRRHPEEGVRMLANVPFLDKALDVVRHHHERWDGGGYPDGLSGEEIPLWARIFSVIDALDAMTAERPYRAGRRYDAALAEIRRNAGTQFDPAVVEALERLDPATVEPLLEPPQQVAPPDAAASAEAGESEAADGAAVGPLVTA